ncbi:MAG: AAA family ATPase, partial [Gemmatimonadaceae bacterium]
SAVVGDDFTDRAPERKAIADALRTPGGHLLLVGPRRIGKTSLLRAVQHDVRARKGPPVLYLDLWSASTIEDMTTRLALEAAAVLGRTWTDLVKKLAQRLQFRLEVSTLPDGRLVPVPTLAFREAPLDQQRARLVTALDTLEAQAKAHRVHLGVILDEFQEIERLGRDAADHASVSAMRQVRAAIQHHRHVSYVFAGSDRVLIERLSDPKHGPMHNLARRYEIGPLAEAHFAAWIEHRFAAMGVNATGCGLPIIALAGPRTRDVRTLAESAAERARGARRLTPAALDAPLRDVVAQRGPQYDAQWKDLTPLQQNCLRAVAAGERRLTSDAVLTRYALGDTSRTAKTLAALTTRAILVRDGARHTFDDPFFRAWVIVSVLPDVGLQLPITHLPPA